jgi:AcrR family transcriptional regulator
MTPDDLCVHSHPASPGTAGPSEFLALRANLRDTKIFLTILVVTSVPVEKRPPWERRGLEELMREPEGLRERKKLATRHALGIAAMRLAVQRGLDNVVTDDIAAVAGVSARTFNNYFASKYEAICSLSMDRGRLVGWALRRMPPGVPLMDAITSAVLGPFGAADEAPDPDWIAGIRLVIQSPELQGEYLRTLHATQTALAEAIADRISADPRAEMFPAVLAGAVTSAIQVAMERWLTADPPTALAPLVRQALGQLRCSLPTVTPTANPVAVVDRQAHPYQGRPEPDREPPASDSC